MATATKKTTTTSTASAVASNAAKYGSNFQAPSAGAPYGSYVASSPSTKSSNPVVGATQVRSSNERTGADLSGLKSAYAADAAMLQQQQAALAERRTTEIAGIKTEFDIAKGAQEAGQAQDYASRSTSLITSGGGFLGATQSQQGVLQNLQHTFDTERTALMAKREAAINAANIAYEDKDFALARELSKNARDLQSEIYNRQKDYADQTLAITRENRAQTEFDMGIAEKKAQNYAYMSDEDFAKVNPSEYSQYDSVLGQGFTANKRAIDVQARNVKTQQDAVDLDYKILSARNSTPYGTKITLGGKVYTGLKVNEPKAIPQGDKDAILRSKINTLFTPGHIVPGSDSNGLQSTVPTPILGTDGYATPEGWKAVIGVSGLDRADFVKQYGYLVNTKEITKYGLTQPEKDLVVGKL